MNTETLRDLVVSLSLDSGDFEKHIRLVNKSVKEFESEFTLAAAGIENFETSLKGMGEKAQLLKQQLSAQNEIVGQYAKKLDALNEKLTENRARHTSLSDLLEKETAARNALKAKVDEQRKEVIRLTQAYGEDDQRVKDARDALAQFSGELDDANKAVKSAQGKLTAVEKNIYSVGAAIMDTNTSLNSAKARVRELNIELAKNESSWYKHGVAMQAFAGRAQAAAQSVDQVGGKLTTAITMPLIGAGVAMGKAAIDFESAFAGVRKTVSVSEEEAEEFFETLADSAVQMSKTLATSAVDISEVMAIAGQLGIAKDALDEFTDVVIRMGMSTNMSTEDAATQMARFANITGMLESEYKSLGSAVVYLGNNFATTEGEIMAMAMRIAAAGTQVGLSKSEILGFAAALSSVGLEAEAGGSAFSTALKKMEVAVETGSKALGDFAKVSGLTQEEFKKLWQNNPAEAFQAFIVGLANMDEAGESAVATLNEIGITQLRLSDTLLRSAGAAEMIAEAQAGANMAWSEGEALMKESNTRLETMASKLTNIKNTLVAAGIAFGDSMMPTIEKGTDWIAELAEDFSELDDQTRDNIITWGLYAAATGPALKALGKIGTTVTGGIDLMGKFAKRIGEAGAALKTTGSMATALSTLLGIGGGLMLGITAVTAALGGLIYMYQKVEASKPDLSIDTSEIDNLKIDVDDLEIKTEADLKVELKEGVKSARDQVIDILNDGLPEGEQEQAQMSAAVQNAIGVAYDAIKTKFETKQAELDALYAGGIIDKATYDQGMTELTDQATAMQTELDASAKAVNDYITLMVANNRQMTEAEIAELDKLLEKLGLTAEKIALANDAEKQAYAWAYQKTKLSVGDESDAQRAAEYVELVADERLAVIKAQEEALRKMYGEKSAAAQTEEEQIRLAQEETAALEKLQKQREIVYGEKLGMQADMLGGVLKTGGMSIEDLEEYVRLREEATKLIPEAEDGLTWQERDKNLFLHPFNLAEAEKNLLAAEEIAKRLDESGLFDEGGILSRMFATNASQGIFTENDLSTTQGVMNALGQILEYSTQVEASKGEMVATTQQTGDEVRKTAVDATDGYGIGTDMMSGMAKGIYDGAEGAARAARMAMGRIQAAAKDAMEIHSPSRWAERELGANTMKGFGKGVTGELPSTEKLMINAMKHLQGEVGGAAGGTTDNRKTYNSENSVNVTIEHMELRDRQDVQTLATEIASMTRTNQRGKGARYA